ncbi:MAG TPA: glycosyltransferase family 1 protein [Longimicrobiales bacterium]|nr:glycosyltransferase family 1 protein [Longimicrobiales bacterium]
MRLAVNGRFYAAPLTGVQRFAVEVTRRLAQLAEVELFLPAGAEAPSEVAARVGIHRGRLRGHAWEQLELPAALARARCDVELHLAGTAPLSAAGHVLAIHDLLPLSNPEWFGRRFRLWRGAVLRRSAPRAGAVLAVSDWAAEEVKRRLGVAPRRLFVVTQGLEPFDAPAPAGAVARVRARYALPERFLLAVGAGDPRKNLGFLETVRECWRAAGGAPPPLVVVGGSAPRVHPAAARGDAPFARIYPPPGPEPRPPAAPAHLDRAAGGALLLGRVPDDELHALYTAASALCFPSLAEGFGRPPLEALACGTPAVAADYAAAREVLGRWLPVLPLDAALWARTLAELVAGGPARDATLALGRGLPGRFRWDTAAAQVISACHAAAAERGGRP